VQAFLLQNFDSKQQFSLRLPVTSIKPCKTTSWRLDASQPICYFTDFAV